MSAVIDLRQNLRDRRRVDLVIVQTDVLLLLVSQATLRPEQ